MSALANIIAGAVAALLFAAVAFIKGQSAGRQKEKADRAKMELEAHDRITDADIGIGASDADRIKRLRELGRTLGERN